MARPKKGVTLEMRAKEALVFGEDGHWWSTMPPFMPHKGLMFRLKSGGRQVSQLLVLWQIYLGDPVGLLSNACGRAECVNPYHYRDESDRQQADWRAETFKLSEAVAPWTREEEDRCMQLLDIVNESSASIENNYGMTHDMGCYHCGKRFDPLAHRNKVICPECWTDEDQAEAEANLVD